MTWPRCRSVLVSLVALAIAGCGTAETTPTGGVATTVIAAPPPTMAPPATALYVPPDPNATVGALAPVEVSQPCPTSDPSATGPEMFDEATRLEPMLGQVLAYGQAHPEVWGSYGLVWQGAGEASVFVSFTTDVDAHRAALADQAAFPDELIVCQVAITGAEAQALQTQLSRELAGRFASIGVGTSGAVDVVLLPGEEATGSQLSAQYGNAVVVTYGELEQLSV
ncbi:MAG: hypothetical protein NTZ21_16200 [Actinobacteria bacterium]|nr:hypothetical protein [Actinomycetota bacterium]